MCSDLRHVRIITNAASAMEFAADSTGSLSARVDRFIERDREARDWLAGRCGGIPGLARRAIPDLFRHFGGL